MGKYNWTALRLTLPIGVLAVACSAALEAAPVTISDAGSDFTVTYDDEQTGLFGTPTLLNNTIFFTPSGFVAESLNGEGRALTNDTIQLVLDAVGDGTLDSFDLQERGDYLLNGPTASVDVRGQLGVFDTSNPFDFFSDFIDTTSDMTINDDELHEWTATALVDSGTGWSGANQVVLTIENILLADTGPGDASAFIEKKFEGVQVVVNQVPVPAALWLLGSAIIALRGLSVARRLR